MRKRCIRRTMIVVATAWLTPWVVSGQQLFSDAAPREPGAKSWELERAKLPPFDPPRTSRGVPDLQGRWGGTPGGDILEAHDYVDISTPAEEAFVSDPADGLIPYQSWAQATRARHRAGLARGWPGETERLYHDPQTYCLYSVPRATYRGGFDIYQLPDKVIVAYNFGHYYRVIPTDGRPRVLGDDVKLWMGNSRGRWEGDTLVVEVTNLNARNWLDSAGNFFSDSVRVVERFRLASADIIDYEVTFEDPRVYTRPWSIRLPLRRVDLREAAPGNNAYTREVWEHACHEGNRDGEKAREAGFEWFKGVVPPE